MISFRDAMEKIWNVAAAGMIGLLSATSSHAEGLLTSEPVAFQPSNKIAREAVGPIIASQSKIVFRDGQVLDLALTETADSKNYGDEEQVYGVVQVFEISGLVRQGEGAPTICGGKPDFLVVFGVNNDEVDRIKSFYFSSGDRPRSIVKDEPGSCGATLFLPPENDAVRISAADGSKSENENAGESIEGVTAGKWQASTKENPLDDSESVYLRLVADDVSEGKLPTLLARCRSNVTELYINWSEYLGDDSYDVYEDFKYVTIRLDNQEARREQWDISTDHKAVFAPNWAGTLLKSMVGKSRLVVQVTPYNENPRTAIFDISGLEEPLESLSEACGWSF